jgi:hypothetical protein
VRPCTARSSERDDRRRSPPRRHPRPERVGVGPNLVAGSPVYRSATPSPATDDPRWRDQPEGRDSATPAAVGASTSATWGPGPRGRRTSDTSSMLTRSPSGPAK